MNPKYKLTLGNTYYSKGFFNLGIDVERHITYEEGPFVVFVGENKREIKGRVSREANQNGTPRIYGGAELRDWFQANFRKGERVDVLILAEDQVWIK